MINAILFILQVEFYKPSVDQLTVKCQSFGMLIKYLDVVEKSKVKLEEEIKTTASGLEP